MNAPLLDVQALSIRYQTDGGELWAVNKLDFCLNPNEILGIVGESGSGKTQMALSLLGLLPESAQVSGQAMFNRRDLLSLSEAELNTIRGNDIAMIFQDPMTALNPHLTIGKQMTRVLRRHRGMSGREAGAATTRMAVVDRSTWSTGGHSYSSAPGGRTGFFVSVADTSRYAGTSGRTSTSAAGKSATSGG